MQTFDAYPIAIVIATALFLAIVILFAWAMNRWLQSREKVGTMRQISRVV